MEAKIRSVWWIFHLVIPTLICTVVTSENYYRVSPSIHRLSLQWRAVPHVEHWAIISVIRRHGRCMPTWPCRRDKRDVAGTCAYGMPTTRAGSGHRPCPPAWLTVRPSFRSFALRCVASRVRPIDRNIFPHNGHRVTRWGLGLLPCL